jgi:uncharacterized membrane protein
VVVEEDIFILEEPNVKLFLFLLVGIAVLAILSFPNSVPKWNLFLLDPYGTMGGTNWESLFSSKISSFKEKSFIVLFLFLPIVGGGLKKGLFSNISSSIYLLFLFYYYYNWKISFVIIPFLLSFSSKSSFYSFKDKSNFFLKLFKFPFFTGFYNYNKSYSKSFISISSSFFLFFSSGLKTKSS